MKQATNRDKVEEFHRVMGQAVGAEPTVELLKQRIHICKEEFKEWLHEMSAAIDEINETGRVSRERLIKITAENADVEYVFHGNAVMFGLPSQEAFNRIHAANLTKLWADGRPRYRDDGKVLKPEGWEPARFDDLFPEVV